MDCKRCVPLLLMRVAVSSYCALSAAACLGGVVGGGPLIERLNGRGPILLASDNPYLPANRLLQEEVASSDTMRDFVGRRGAPAALGVTRGLLARPEIQLYYPEQGEVYSFKRKSGDWQTLGPEEISSADRDSLALNGVPGPQDSERVPPSDGSELEARILAQLEQEPDDGSRAGIKPPFETSSAGLKKLPNGSYRHTVTFSGETPAKLADWYAGSAAAASKLSGIGAVSPHGALRKGTQVTIPKSVMRNPLALPKAALE
jgi:hypothetical protein